MWHVSLDTPYKRMMHSKWVSTLLLLGNVCTTRYVIFLHGNLLSFFPHSHLSTLFTSFKSFIHVFSEPIFSKTFPREFFTFFPLFGFSHFPHTLFPHFSPIFSTIFFFHIFSRYFPHFSHAMFFTLFSHYFFHSFSTLFPCVIVFHIFSTLFSQYSFKIK